MDLAKLMRLLKLLFLTAFSCSALVAQAAQTTGGVSFLDTLGYEKPKFYPITVPDEATVTNKYYIFFGSGSGTTCSQASPCNAFSALAGKAGMNGGPAYVYVKSNGNAGQLDTGGLTMFGSTGNEIVIKPWPNDSTTTTWTAASGCQLTNAHRITGSGVHHVIFDGGPSMLFRFTGNASPSCATQNNYAMIINSNDITVTRIRLNGNNVAGPTLGIATGSGTSTSRVRWINSEIYGATTYYGVYTGGGTGCGAGDTSHTNIEFRNGIIRQAEGRGIQIEPRSNSSGFIIDGMAFHDVGYDRSGANNGVSCAIQPADSCSGTTSNLYATNNMIWDTGGGGICIVQSSSTQFFYNNTIYDYANALPLSSSSRGITAYASSMTAKVYNNIVLGGNNGMGAFHNDASFGSASNSDNNLCESATTCGNSRVVDTVANTFVSTDPNSPNFLKLRSASLGKDAGTNASAITNTNSYNGVTRPKGAGYDIGAWEQWGPVLNFRVQ
jgi:hypothetical protein